jgi:hypothetical protein
MFNNTFQLLNNTEAKNWFESSTITEFELHERPH